MRLGKAEAVWTSLGQVVRGSMPFFLLRLAGAAVLATFPSIALRLPATWPD